jgi:hypothetical protein
MQNWVWNVLINALRGGRDKEFAAFRSRLITIKTAKIPLLCLSKFED